MSTKPGGSRGVGAGRRHRSADREVLDHVAVPAVASFDELHADDAFRLERLRLVRHALHRELARVVERLREVRHLDVLADLARPLAEALVGDVVDARAHHQAEWPVAGREQGVEVLARQVARERPAVGRPVEHPVAMADGRPDRDELRQALAPLVAAHVEPDADDPVGAELLGLLLHPRHRELPRVVHRLAQHRELLVSIPAASLKSDVVDRAADHEPDRVETRRLDQHELVDAEVAREELRGLHRLEAVDAVLGQSLRRAGVVALFGLFAHRTPSRVRARSICGGGACPAISTTAVPMRMRRDDHVLLAARSGAFVLLLAAVDLDAEAHDAARLEPLRLRLRPRADHLPGVVDAVREVRELLVRGKAAARRQPWL